LQASYDSDFLDDTALIKAFDNAINPIKVFSDCIVTVTSDDIMYIVHK